MEVLNSSTAMGLESFSADAQRRRGKAPVVSRTYLATPLEFANAGVVAGNVVAKIAVLRRRWVSWGMKGKGNEACSHCSAWFYKGKTSMA